MSNTRNLASSNSVQKKREILSRYVRNTLKLLTSTTKSNLTPVKNNLREELLIGYILNPFHIVFSRVCYLFIESIHIENYMEISSWMKTSNFSMPIIVPKKCCNMPSILFQTIVFWTSLWLRIIQNLLNYATKA